jgi:hypothetical protein
LPSLRIQRTDMRREIVFEEDPSTPRFGAWDEAAFRP